MSQRAMKSPAARKCWAVVRHYLAIFVILLNMPKSVFGRKIKAVAYVYTERTLHASRCTYCGCCANVVK